MSFANTVYMTFYMTFLLAMLSFMAAYALGDMNNKIDKIVKQMCEVHEGSGDK